MHSSRQHDVKKSMQASVYIATSIDGFIARADGGIDWLQQGGTSSDEEDYGYQDFMGTVDALVMGRNTYELVRTFGAWPFGKKQVVVLSSRPVKIPADLADTVESMPPAPRDVFTALASRGFHHLYVDGGKTVQGFLREGLIDRLTITRIPILIGSGIPLFGTLPHDVRLKHLQTRAYPSGLVQSVYDVVR